MAALVSTGYGKCDVRLMRVDREGERYSVTELRVNVELQLRSSKDYERGDNSDVVATDSMKNTVLVMARKHHIVSPESFCLRLCKHFISTYPQLTSCTVSAEQAPWQRFRQGGAEHAHAFMMEPSVTRFCTVTLSKGAMQPTIYGGLKDMKVLKATKSGFEGFVRDQFTTLPETSDRTFCTRVFAKYQVDGSAQDVEFNGIWNVVKDSILDVFAGPPDSGSYSPSVQNTIYECGKLILLRIPVITNVEIHMPNIHYFVADLKKLNITNSGELLLPSNEPWGIIKATLARPTSKL